MEMPRRSSRIFDLDDSNPIDFVEIPSVFKNCTTDDRKFWRLRDFLVTEDEKSTKSSSYFILQNETWRFFSHHGFFNYHMCILSIRMHTFFNDAAVDQFNVRIGIVTESGEETEWSEAKASTDMFSTYIRVHGGTLQSAEKSGSEVYFYVEIKRKEEEKRRKVPLRIPDLKDFLLRGEYSDFTIKVKETAFKVHRSILGSRSPVFLEMTKYEWPPTENCKWEVSINDVDPAIFKEFLLYLHSGSAEHLNLKNLSEFYKLGDTYCVQDLKELCIEYGKSNLCMENFFDIFLISQESNNLELLEAVIQFFRKDQKEIIRSENCLNFLTNHPDKACVLSILIYTANC